MLLACRSAPMPPATAAPSSPPRRRWSTATARSACGSATSPAAPGSGRAPSTAASGASASCCSAWSDDRERELQDELLRGAPPLGPGAPPAERLLAFFDALHTHVVAQRSVLAVADEAAPMTRYATGAYAAWRTHVALLVAELLPDAELRGARRPAARAALRGSAGASRRRARRPRAGRARRAARPRGAGVRSARGRRRAGVAEPRAPRLALGGPRTLGALANERSGLQDCSGIRRSVLLSLPTEEDER